jgi:hypothetical protein
MADLREEGFQPAVLRSVIGNLPEMLAHDIHRTGEQAIYIEAEPQMGRYVQVLMDRHGEFWVECVSNHFLADEKKLDEAQESKLVELGFFAPEEEASGHPNWWWNAEGIGTSFEVARKMARVLLEVFGISPWHTVWIGRKVLRSS